MDGTFLLILLVTGFCATAANIIKLTFTNQLKTWYDADLYCRDHDKTLIQNINISDWRWFNSSYGKIWTGVNNTPSNIIQPNEEAGLYFNWSFEQPDNILSELCVSMTSVGDWYNRHCSELKIAVCYNGTISFTKTQMNWTSAVKTCMANSSTLVKIQDNETNAEIRYMLSNGSEVWIGLYQKDFWSWIEAGTSLTSINWIEGQLGNLTRDKQCAAMWLENRTLTQESCNEQHPFVCSYNSTDLISSESWGSMKTWVKLKIETAANLEDPNISAGIEQQLRAMLGAQGVTNIKLAWKKVSGSQQKGNP